MADKKSEDLKVDVAGQSPQPINQPENVTIHEAPQLPVTPGAAITNILGSATRLCLVIMTVAASIAIFLPFSINESALDLFRFAYGIVLGGFFSQVAPSVAGSIGDRMQGK